MSIVCVVEQTEFGETYAVGVTCFSKELLCVLRIKLSFAEARIAGHIRYDTPAGELTTLSDGLNECLTVDCIGKSLSDAGIIERSLNCVDGVVVCGELRSNLVVISHLSRLKSVLSNACEPVDLTCDVHVVVGVVVVRSVEDDFIKLDSICIPVSFVLFTNDSGLRCPLLENVRTVTYEVLRKNPCITILLDCMLGNNCE